MAVTYTCRTVRILPIDSLTLNTPVVENNMCTFTPLHVKLPFFLTVAASIECRIF